MNGDIPPPPPGFMLDDDPAMSKDIPPPPAGFVLDGQTGPQHYDFDGSQIPGYDPATGMVERGAPQSSAPRFSSTLMGAIEGLPVVGPYARQGVEAAASGIGSAISGEPYDKVRSEIGGMAQESISQHPYLNKAGQVGGAIAGTIPMVAAAPGLFGAGAGPLGAGLVGRMGMGGLSGAALGAADAGTRSDFDPSAMLKGAAWGGSLGVVAPAVGEVAGAAARKYRNWRSPGGTRAEQAFGRAAGADSIDDVSTRLADLGDDAMPMDLGPNLQRQAGALAATPGDAQKTIRGAIEARQGAAGTRVAGALDDALGQPVDTMSLADDIIAKRSAAAKPLYDAAYAKPVPFTKELENLLTRPSVRKALAKAQTLAADEGIPSQQWFANIADDGAVTIKNVPDVRQLDLTKRALDDMISAAQRTGNGNEARILIQQKESLTKMVDAAVPEYAKARAAFSGPSQVIDALDEGQKAFANNLTPKQLGNKLLKMGAAEREAYIQGARAKVAQVMGTARNDSLAAKTTFAKGWNKEKLNILVGKDQADKLLRTIDAETAFTKTRDVVTGNSETAARLAAQADVGAGGAGGAGVLERAGNLEFGTAFARMGDKLLGGAKNAAQQNVNSELARLLTSRDAGSLNRVIKMVQAAQQRGDISAQRARDIIQSTMVAAAQERRPTVPAPVGTR